MTSQCSGKQFSMLTIYKFTLYLLDLQEHVLKCFADISQTFQNIFM